MSRGMIKPWMLVYSMIFFVLTIFFVLNNSENRYHITFVLWSIIIYLLANIGNLLYSVSYSNNAIRRYWRIIPFIVVFHFVLENIIDIYFGQHVKEAGFLLVVIMWIIVFLQPTDS